MTPKEKLYYLLDNYLKGSYETKIFCDQFSITFNIERDDSLTELEEEIFEELSVITNRFSPYEEDLKIPGAFFNERQVREKAIETSKKLKKHGDDSPASI